MIIIKKRPSPGMKVVKQAVVVYLVGVLAIVVRVCGWLDPPFDSSLELAVFLFPLAVVIAGLALGWFGIMIIQYSKWVRSFYIAGLNLAFILFLGFLVFSVFKEWQNERRYGYDANTADMLQSADNDGWLYAADGFEELQRSFEHSRRVRLSSWTVDWRDSIVGAKKDSIATVYYTYYFGRDTAVRFGKVEVMDRKARVISLNQYPASDTVYLRLEAQLRVRYRETKAIIESALKSLKNP